MIAHPPEGVPSRSLLNYYMCCTAPCERVGIHACIHKYNISHIVYGAALIVRHVWYTLGATQDTLTPTFRHVFKSNHLMT